MTTILLYNQLKKARAYELNYSKLLAVLALYDTDMNATQLAETILVSRAGVTGVIDKLEELRMVKRVRTCTFDRRSYTIRMTEQGRAVVKDITGTSI